MLCGATTPGGASFVATVTGGGPVRVAVADNEDMTSPVFTASQTVDAQGVARVQISGLTAAQRYWWRVEDNGTIDTSRTGTFRTHPPAGLPSTFTVVVAGDAGLDPAYPGVAGGELDANKVSNHPVHATIAQLARDNDWLAFYQIGDWGYPNFGTDTVDSLANRRTYLDDNLAQPNQATLFDSISMEWFWDDHDFERNDSDGTAPGKANAAQIYRERMPSGGILTDPSGIWRTWKISRVRFIAFDVRYYRSPNSDPDGSSKTMLGSAQKAWLDTLLSNRDSELLVWLMPSQWLGSSSHDDSWSAFATERAELADMILTYGYAGRVVMANADRHALGLDSGGNNRWGGFPVLLAASLDSRPSVADPEVVYDLGPDTPGRGQFGTITIADLGTHLTVTLTGWQDTTQWASYTFGVKASTPTAASDALARLLRGSHSPRFEARIVAGFATGDDPDGTELDVITGDVFFDGDALIRGSLALQIPGVDAARRERWPRSPTDPLAPYGTEIYIRYGIDLGGAGTHWVPLGYYRIGPHLEQDDSPDGDLFLAGRDRMRGLARAKLLAPRSFSASRTLQSVFDELVLEVYPTAVVIMDDIGADTLGREVTIERDRARGLRELATARGRVLFWDDLGFLRAEEPADEQSPQWQLRAGANLDRVSRQITDEEVYSAVVFTGEGLEGSAVRAVAVDGNPASPTYFYGEFGPVPLFESSPAVTTELQAKLAAQARLRQVLGAPYQFTVDGVANPALRPDMPVWVEQRSFERQKHVLRTVRLNSEGVMSVTTRQQLQAVLL